MSQQGSKIPVFIRVGATFAAVGLGCAALGIASLTNVIRGGLGLSILTLILALVWFGIAGYLFWGYRWLKEHPGGNGQRR
jgi:hypothetical protein